MLLQGEWDEAATMFRSALDTGVTEFVEYTGAKVELERISAIRRGRQAEAR